MTGRGIGENPRSNRDCECQQGKDVPKAIQDITGGGAHMSMDALGSVATCRNSILCLRKRGRHVQVGLMVGDHSDPSLPMGPVIGENWNFLGAMECKRTAIPRCYG